MSSRICADALEHRIRSDAVGKLFDPRVAIISTLGDDVCRPEALGGLLALFIPAHSDDPFGPSITDSSIRILNRVKLKFLIRRKVKPLAAP